VSLMNEVVAFVLHVHKTYILQQTMVMVIGINVKNNGKSIYIYIQ